MCGSCYSNTRLSQRSKILLFTREDPVTEKLAQLRQYLSVHVYQVATSCEVNLAVGRIDEKRSPWVYVSSVYQRCRIETYRAGEQSPFSIRRRSRRPVISFMWPCFRIFFGFGVPANIIAIGCLVFAFEAFEGIHSCNVLICFVCSELLSK